MTEPFHFYSQVHLVRLLGRRARTARELLDGIREVPAASIYYHTHRSLQQHHFASPEPTNDFAYWLTGELNLRPLGEQVASVDIVRFKSIEELRTALVSILEPAVAGDARKVVCPEGGEFHFKGCVSFVLPTGLQASTPEEFAAALERVSVGSLYFHMFEAPLRLKQDTNDFSRWFESIGQAGVAREIARLDPYTITLDGLRKNIVRIVQTHALH